MKNDPDSAAPSISELKRRLLYTLFQPAAALARRLHVPLDEFESLGRLAFYEELRGRGGMTQSEVAKFFGKSLRTVTSVEKQLQSDFLAPAREVELSRRVEERLSEKTWTPEALCVALGESDEDEIRRILESLVHAGRAARADCASESAAYSGVERYHSLVQSDLVARIDGVRHQLSVILAAVQARFLAPPDDAKPSTARTLAFMGRPDDVAAMAEAIVREIRLRAIDVEESALQAGEYGHFAMTVAVAPSEE